MNIARYAIGLGLVMALTGFADASCAADALDHWTINDFHNVYGLLFGGDRPEVTAVAFGNGRYVAVGKYFDSDWGFIESSDDGIDWSIRRDGLFPLHPALKLFDVAYGNGIFVAVGCDGNSGRNLYTSTDGINWDSQTNATVSNFYGVVYGSGRFIAVGDGAIPGGFGTTNRNIYTSPNGIIWKGRVSGAPADELHQIMDVAYGAGQFVAVDNTGYVYSSSFGNIWTTNFLGGGTQVSFCNGLFIVPAGVGSNLVSSDGLTWSVLTNDTGSAFGHVVYGNELYLALSSTAIFTSTDATNWVQRSTSAVGLVDAVFGSSNVVLVGYFLIPTPPCSIYYSDHALAIVSDPFVTLDVAGGPAPQLSVSGLLNHSYEIDYKTNLSDTNWMQLTTISLTNSPYVWTDPSATDPQRFYRVGLLP